MNYRFLFLRIGTKFIRSRYAILLLPIGWIWDLISRLRHFCYDKGYFKTEKVAIPVISVGNIAAGGTGKTPFVVRLAKRFSHKSVAILLRGYGKDEEHILKNHLPMATIYANPDRVKSAKRAIASGAELIILDDGFQHRRLARDVDIVLVKQSDHRGRCIPAGDLRENPRRLNKADIVIPESDIQTRVQRILTRQGQEIASIEGLRVGVFCGIGNPAKFKKTVEDLGAVVAAEWVLADHEPIDRNRLNSFYEKCKSLNISYLVCTEKDAVKLPKTDHPILFLEIEVEVHDFEKLVAKIEERMYNDTQL